MQFDVRLTPESGHVQCTSSCPLRAKSGLMQRSKGDRHLITSSARAVSGLAGFPIESSLAPPVVAVQMPS
jgi:hypothetical protein